ncbi:reverse transcriptase domain-containing protein [Tanacetum coccineum]|uniref:Reverse transcriptase domain-containing protein n=1 Tax=Tanacetum coccineum TaxID=301880 RepID=A0ABQ4YG12_9ASTR
MLVNKLFEEVRKGDGRDIRFSKDRWVDNRILRDRFPRLYHLDCRKEGNVFDKGYLVNNEWNWVWDWNRWMLDEGGEFKVKTLTSLIEEKILQGDSGGVDTLWNKLVPKKVNIFLWRARKGRLPVHAELKRRGIELDLVLHASCNYTIVWNHVLIVYTRDSHSDWIGFDSSYPMAGPVEGGGLEGTDDQEETPPPLTKEQIEDGTTDPEDRLSRFAGAANSGEWPMSVWCRMFQHTYNGSARGWFEHLPYDNINEWAELRDAFAARYSARRACFTEPHEITKIVRKANE